MAERVEAVKVIVDAAQNNKDDLEKTVKLLSDGGRRERQLAAAALFELAKIDPTLLVDYIDDIIDALNRPEAQTRWECLETLTLLIGIDARGCGKALQEAESALFDEDSGFVRLSAMRFLCKYGSTTALRSEKVWSLVDEGIQCYHGDLEFNDMMNAVIDFAAGKLDPEVAKSLAERMSFDANNGKGTIKRKAQQVLDTLQATQA